MMVLVPHDSLLPWLRLPKTGVRIVQFVPDLVKKRVDSANGAIAYLARSVTRHADRRAAFQRLEAGLQSLEGESGFRPYNGQPSRLSKYANTELLKAFIHCDKWDLFLDHVRVHRVEVDLNFFTWMRTWVQGQWQKHRGDQEAMRAAFQKFESG